MDLHLRDKHILITGGSKGIGLACAEAFLQEGARVTLVSRDAANLARARQQLAAHDASYEDLAVKFLEHFAYIAEAAYRQGLWDDEDGFFYDQLVRPDGSREPIRVRSLVGVIPVLAGAFIDQGSRFAASPKPWTPRRGATWSSAPSNTRRCSIRPKHSPGAAGWA